MRTLCNLVLLLVLVCLGAARADACLCLDGGGTVCQEYWKASAVFVGTVRDIKTVRLKRGEYQIPRRLVRFSLDERFRGVETTEVEVLTGTGGGDCGFSFKEAHPYLVYASLVEGKLETSICVGTKSLTSAGADLDYLHGLKNAKPSGTISGQVTAYKLNEKGDNPRQGLPWATVIVEGPERHEVVTDVDGNYRLSLPPGNYIVKISLPKGTTIKQTEEEITLPHGGCANASFWLENDGQLSGRVLDLRGLPVSKAELFLSQLDKERYHGRSETVWSDQDGKYAFKQIAPGRYTLMIRFDGMTSRDRPFPLTYYPGVSDRAQAKVITIGEGQIITDYNLEIPPLPLEYEVAGNVVWPDGRPAVEARVSYMVVGFSELYGTWNEESTFHFKAYGGLQLAIRATLELEKGKYLYSDWVQITVRPGLPPLRFVLQP